jgi:tRNA A-37 threonylcarbamoyl transferase component Bud32
MTGIRRSGENSSGEAGEPGWETRLVQKIEDMERRARQLQERWTESFGPEPFRNSRFASAYVGLLRGQPVIGILKAVYARDKVEEELSAAAFEAHLEKSVRAIEAPAPDSDLLPLSLFYYFDLLLEEARAVQGQHRLAYPEPLQQLLTFGRRIREHAALGPFRVDVPRPEGASPAPAAAAEPPSDLPKGFPLGSVEVVRRIGAGRFAQVYQVFHPGLKEHRTAKVYRKQDLPGDPGEFRKALLAEVQAQQTLQHPNIVRAVEVEDHPAYVVLHQESVEGSNLKSAIDARKAERSHLAPVEILDFALPIAKGLQHAHLRGIVHRDLKPENILVSRDGAVRITDFGVARALNDCAPRSSVRLRNLVGAANTLAPEQILGEAADPRADLYALGAVMYHLAWGEPLFHVRDPWKALQMHRERTPIPLSIAVAAFPEELNRIVMKLLEKRPGDRYASAGDLIRDLEACRAVLPAKRTRRQARQRGSRLLLAAAVILVALGLLAAAWVQARRHRDATPRVTEPKSP